MGKELATVDASAYAALSLDMKEAAAVIHEMGGIDLRRDLMTLTGISPGGKSWDVVLPTGEIQELNAVQGVIVVRRPTRIYYETAYDPNTAEPPACWSEPDADGWWHGNSDNPKLDGSPCDACPHNKFGSAANGKGKACSEYVSLIMYRPEDALLPINVRVPPAALKALNNYKSQLLRVGLTYSKVITEVGLDAVKGATPTWTFRMLGKVDEATAKQLAARAQLFAAASAGGKPVDQSQATNEPPPAEPDEGDGPSF